MQISMQLVGFRYVLSSTCGIRFPSGVRGRKRVLQHFGVPETASA